MQQPFPIRHAALLVWVGIAVVMLGLGPLQEFPGVTWHDQQRLLQIAIAAVAFLALVVALPTQVTWSRRAVIGVGVLFLLGMASIVQAEFPDRALADYALLVCSVGIAACVYGVRRNFPEGTDALLSLLIRMILLANALQFYVLFAAAQAQPELYFSLGNLFTGFSNPRHQGQFLTLVVPVLLVRMSFSGAVRKWHWALDVFALLSICAGVFLAGTRGTIAAWLAMSVAFFFLGGGARSIAFRMLAVLVAGFFLAWCLLEILNIQFAEALRLRFMGSEVFGLSARERLWWPAWEGIQAHPWLGIGPMHFAAMGNLVANHPHQAILQLALEWGVPATLLIVAMVAQWFWRALQGARQMSSTEGGELAWVLLFSVGASTIQSMVDGVLVMPYPQLWLAITVGWASAYLLPQGGGRVVSFSSWIPMLLLGSAVLILVATAAADYPLLVGAPEYCGGGPRFWCNGRIP